VGSTMVLDSGVDIEGTALASRNSSRLIATTPDGSRLDATFNLSKRFLGSAHRYDTRKSRDHDFRSE
jgi:hypothetical protein